MFAAHLKTQKTSTAKMIDYSIYKGNLNDIRFNKKTVINTINQYSYMVAENDNEFKSALLASDILLPDGVGVTAAMKVLSNENVKKIAGADIHVYILEKLNASGGRVFYLGSSENTLSLIEKRLADEYPNITVKTLSPPFKQNFTQAESLAFVATINSFNPDALFIGMTAPKQEKWAAKYKDELDAKIICSIGAVFDFYAGTINRPGDFWIDMGLEWMVRLAQNPKRMAKRYLYYGPAFIRDIFKLKMMTQLILQQQIIINKVHKFKYIFPNYKVQS
jgi:N-acetylglucosaminyldiphosphoundecaprenol N-acetyl-beta-D-mannosaminyltransferase